MKKNILVFPCGSEIGLEIYRSVSHSTHFNLYGGSSVEDHGVYVYGNYIGNIPTVDDAAFIDKINEIITQYSIDFIFPAHDAVVLRLAQESSAGNLNCPVITSDINTCEVARSKRRTYTTLQSTVPVPKIYDPGDVSSAEFPLFLKPDVGQGSKGVQVANTPEDVTFYLAKDPSLLVLEYLPGKEYTVDCFTDKTGKLLFCKGRERRRISSGISVNSATVENPGFVQLAQQINDQLAFRGAWFFQLKENNHGNLVLMEIAPRIAGTMGLSRCRGVNLPLLSIFDALGYPIDIIENNYDMTIDRALENSYKHNIVYQHVYLDFDDLVLFEGKVNPSVIAFVYQCLNKEIQVHLLTKHKQDLNVTLKKHKLDNIFDDFIWIEEGDEKYMHITEMNSIFIDDSYAERKKVHEELRIPVFDVHMLESLMD